MHSGCWSNLPSPCQPDIRNRPDIPDAVITGLKRVRAIWSNTIASDISFTFIMSAKKAAQWLCVCTAGSSPPIHITPHVTREQRYQGGAAIWLREDAIDHLSWVWCSVLRKSQCESDIPASVEKQLCCPCEPTQPLERPETTAFCCFFPSVAKICSDIRWKILGALQVREASKTTAGDVCQYQMCAVSNLCAASSAL